MSQRCRSENLEICALTASIGFARYRAVLEEIPAEVLDHPISVRGEVDGRSDLTDFRGAFQDLPKEVRGRRRQCVVLLFEQRRREPGCRLTVTSAYSRIAAPVARPQRPAPTIVTRSRWFKVVSTVIVMFCSL